jgi:hypothetical protein
MLKDVAVSRIAYHAIGACSRETALLAEGRQVHALTGNSEGHDDCVG